MTIILDKNNSFKLSTLKNVIDISRIMFYTIDIKDNENIMVRFFDKECKLVKPYKGNKNAKKSKKSR